MDLGEVTTVPKPLLATFHRMEAGSPNFRPVRHTPNHIVGGCEVPLVFIALNEKEGGLRPAQFWGHAK